MADPRDEIKQQNQKQQELDAMTAAQQLAQQKNATLDQASGGQKTEETEDKQQTIPSVLKAFVIKTADIVKAVISSVAGTVFINLFGTGKQSDGAAAPHGFESPKDTSPAQPQANANTNKPLSSANQLDVDADPLKQQSLKAGKTVQAPEIRGLEPMPDQVNIDAAAHSKHESAGSTSNIFSAVKVGPVVAQLKAPDVSDNNQELLAAAKNVANALAQMEQNVISKDNDDINRPTRKP